MTLLFLILLICYVGVWPFRLLVDGLVNSALVLLGLKYAVPIGSPVWHKRPLRAVLARWRLIRAVRRSRALERVRRPR